MLGPSEGFLERRVLAPLEEAAGRPLRILEIVVGEEGASRGPRLSVSPGGAELERLPFADQQFELVVFRGSFHLAADYRTTLRETRRVLGWGGRVVILDTPLYQSYRDGERARDRRFERGGVPDEALLSMGYLDERMLAELASELNLSWRIHEPWRGLGYWLAPLQAKLARARPPARWKVFVGSWTS
ncbi:MAG: methyltransferase domain-containing protein [Acidobacteria bacterium]|nr:methyltransferase domain-containing protein [Acidobacteriota bacterium]